MKAPQWQDSEFFLKKYTVTTRKKGKRDIFLTSQHSLKNTFLSLNREKIVK